MKWEVFLAMGALMFLGFWLVAGARPAVQEGSTLFRLQAGPVKGHLEVRADDGAPRFRALPRGGDPGAWMSASELDALIPGASATFAGASNTLLFRLFNVTSWGSMAWIAVGLGGQMAFFGRMAVQWVVSERQRQSVVPPVFWYLSLAGGIALFAYFVWRQDLVGVLGQTSGIVIYGRNIRLLFKQRRREARKAARAATAGPAQGDRP